MATITSNPSVTTEADVLAKDVAFPQSDCASSTLSAERPGESALGRAWPAPENLLQETSAPDSSLRKPSHRDALQKLLAFSALMEKMRRRSLSGNRLDGSGGILPASELEDEPGLSLNEVLQLVVERAIGITGADGLAIALAENDELVLRSAAGSVLPDTSARIDRDSVFSGACFRTAETVYCENTATDARANFEICERLGAQSIVAVPLRGRKRVIGVMEAFSTKPFGFADRDIRSLNLLAELIQGSLKPEDEQTLANAARMAEKGLEEHPAVDDLNEVRGRATASSAHLGEPVLGPEKLFVLHAAARSQSPPVTTTVPKRLPRISRLLLIVGITTAFAIGVLWNTRTKRTGGAKAQIGNTGPKVAAPLNRAENPAGIPPRQVGALNPAVSEINSLISDTHPRVTGMQHTSTADASTVVLDLEGPVRYEKHRLSGPNRIYVDLFDTQLPSELAGSSATTEDPLLSRIRVAQPAEGTTRVVLETRDRANAAILLERNPCRLVIKATRSVEPQ
jgi:putative methionine-R-sulfoxide reductase with GAF domain